MQWDDESRREQAALLRWLIDEYESGTLTADMNRPGRLWAAAQPDEFTAWQLVRELVGLATWAEIIRDDEDGQR